MLPMVPNNRDNMIAWLAARCDGENYGKVIEFTFSKEKLIYGPAQIEARIDQDTTISQQLSLWNQTGSRVIRGNLLVIPIDDTLALCRAFISQRREPPVAGAEASDRFHRRSCRHGADCREFARRVGHTGREGSRPVVTSTSAPSPGARANESPPSGANAEALNHYRRAFEALNKGDWRTFGAEMDAMQKALQSAPAKSPP